MNVHSLLKEVFISDVLALKVVQEFQTRMKFERKIMRKIRKSKLVKEGGEVFAKKA